MGTSIQVTCATKRVSVIRSAYPILWESTDHPAHLNQEAIPDTIKGDFGLPFLFLTKCANALLTLATTGE